MTQTEEQQTVEDSNTQVQTPGSILRQARLLNKLSQQDVADSLNLKLIIINAIESDDFDAMPTATFTKGYLRSYAKLLALDESEVLQAYQSMGIESVDPKLKIKSFSNKPKLEKGEHKSVLIPLVLLLIVIAVGLFFWFKVDQNSFSFDSATQDVKTDSSESQSVTAQAFVESSPSDNITVIETQTAPEFILEPEIDSELNQTELAVNRETENQDSEYGVTDKVENTESRLTETVDSSIQATVEIEGPLISMQFTQDCWINVVDATGERIAYGVKKAGRLMQVSGVAPFQVTLGAPENVEVSYNQQAVDMQQFKKGMVARFSLPLENE